MDQLNLLLAALAGIATTAILGAVKAFEAKADIALVSKLGNLTPALVLMLTYLLPKLTTALHLTAVPDVQALANAPLATIIAIACREALVKLKVTSTGGSP